MVFKTSQDCKMDSRFRHEKSPKTTLWNQYHKRFHDFKIGPKFSKTHVFWKTTLYHPLELLRGLLLFYWLSHNHCKLAGGKYRIYSINCRGRLLHFWTLRVGTYSRWALIRGWALIKFSPFSASVICLFCNKAINANKRMRRSNKAGFL